MHHSLQVILCRSRVLLAVGLVYSASLWTACTTDASPNLSADSASNAQQALSESDLFASIGMVEDHERRALGVGTWIGQSTRSEASYVITWVGQGCSDAFPLMASASRGEGSIGTFALPFTGQGPWTTPILDCVDESVDEVLSPFLLLRLLSRLPAEIPPHVMIDDSASASRAHDGPSTASVRVFSSRRPDGTCPSTWRTLTDAPTRSVLWPSAESEEALDSMCPIDRGAPVLRGTTPPDNFDLLGIAVGRASGMTLERLAKPVPAAVPGDQRSTVLDHLVDCYILERDCNVPAAE